MACISAPTALLAGGALSAGTSLIGGMNASSAATQAAKLQAGAATQAAQIQGQEFLTTQANLQPFMRVGENALNFLSGLTGTDLGPNGAIGNPLTAPLTAPIGTTSPVQTTFAPSPGQLAATPGYQFVLGQGRNAVSNQLAASGLAGSGAAGKAQTNYAEGLAGTTFQQQYQNWLTQQQFGLQNWLSQQNLTLAQRQQIYNMIGGLATGGQNAAANLGTQGIASAAQVGNSLTSAGAANAAGVVGSTNALNAGLTGGSSSASNTALLLALQNSGMFGPVGGGGGSSSGPGTDYGGGSDLPRQIG